MSTHQRIPRATPNTPSRAAVPVAATPRVTYQGEPGAFGELAARQRWAEGATLLPAVTFDDAVAMVCDGRADYAVLPVWNSSVGDIVAACSALERAPARLVEVDRVALPVRHCLLALPGTRLRDVRLVGSHPAALAQCAGYLGEHPALQPCEAYDTAGAARELAWLGAGGAAVAEPWYAAAPHLPPNALAAIASIVAAERYGLVVLAAGIQDDPTNETRFVVMQARGARA